MRLQRYEEAINAFDRVLISEPDHVRARYEMARCYFLLKSYDYAEEHFRAVLKMRVPAEVRSSSERYMAMIDSFKHRHRFSIALLGGVGYDSNVYNSTDDYIISPGTVINIGGFPFVLDGRKGETQSDYTHTEMLQLGYSYDIGDIGGLVWQNSLTAYSLNYFDKTENNILYGSLTTGLRYRTDNSRVYGAQGFYDRVYVDREGYTTTQGFKANYMRVISSIGDMIDIGATVGKKNYDDDKERDATIAELTGGWQRYGNSKAYGVSLSTGSESKAERINSNRNYYSISGFYSYNFTESMVGTAQLSARSTDYKGEYMNERLAVVQRTDTLAAVSLSAAYRFTPSLRLNGSYGYQANDSNSKPFEWTKHQVGINLLWQLSN